jgi:hypothetical protein
MLAHAVCSAVVQRSHEQTDCSCANLILLIIVCLPHCTLVVTTTYTYSDFLSVVTLEWEGVTVEAALQLLPVLQAIAERDTHEKRVIICLQCGETLVRMFAPYIRDAR